MKTRILLMALSLIGLGGACQVSASEGTPVNVTVLEKIAPVNVYFTAKADTIESGKLAFAVDRGLISETKKIGDIVVPSLYNADGSIAEKGTPVGKVVNGRQIAAYKAAVMKFKMDEESYKQASDNIDRDKKMEKAISKKQFDDDTTAYNQAKLQLELDKANLLSAQTDLDGTELIAPYSGIITQITRGPGMGVGGSGDDFAVITRMSPIVVKIPFPSEIVNQVDNGKLIQVYPPGASKPVPAWAGISHTDNDMLYAFVMNEIVPNLSTLTEEQKKMPKAYILFPVIPFYETDYAVKLNIVKEHFYRKQYNENLLAVPDFAIHQDDKGTYLLRAVGQDAMVEDKDISPEFTVEKVYIKAGNLRDPNFGPHTLVSIDEPGSLKPYNVIIFAGDKDIKNGDKVAYCRPTWLFRPGDLVKVNIPSITRPGFYVPVNAIIHQGDGDNYVYTVVDGAAKLAQVKLVGTTGDYYSIQGNGIEAGAKVIIPGDKQALELYDGMPVDVKNNIQVSARLMHPHATPLSYPDNTEFFK